MSTWRVWFGVAVLTSALAVAADAWLTSDSRLTDAGRFAAQRYTLDLGPVEPGAAYTHQFRSPSSDRFCLGLRANGWNAEQQASGQAHLVVRHDDTVLIEPPTSLREWTVSTSTGELPPFIYARDPHGTCADLQRYRRYTVTLQLSTAGPVSADTHLIVQGGGWK